MTTAIRAEVRKLTTTQVLLWMVVLAVGLSLLIGGLFGGLASDNDAGAQPMELVLNFIAGFAFLVSSILGVIGLTGEYRHLTATPTFLSVPRRGTVVGAKLVVYLVTGLIIGVLAVAAAVAIAAPLFSSRGQHIDLGSSSTLRIMIGTVIASAIYGLLGVGLGALLRNQVAAVVGLVVYMFIIENILQGVPKVRAAYPYLPGGAASSLLQTADPNAQTDFYTLLPAWEGGLLLLAYGLVFAVVGSLLTVRRDVS
jgi:ABC-2 type transport system permease protein